MHGLWRWRWGTESPKRELEGKHLQSIRVRPRVGTDVRMIFSQLVPVLAGEGVCSGCWLPEYLLLLNILNVNADIRRFLVDKWKR